MASNALTVLAGAGVLVAGFGAATATRSDLALPAIVPVMAAGAPAAGEKCLVDVVRTGKPGDDAISRFELPNGQCVCRIFTGPQGNNGVAETVVDALLRDRECIGAPVAGTSPNAAAGAVGGSAAGGGAGGLILPVVSGVGAIGLGVALGAGSNG